MKIYVGNLSFKSTENELNDLFSQYGEVREVSLVTDRETGRPRGFGFVEMANDSAAREAITALEGQEFGGRASKVSEARRRGPRQFNGGGGGGGFRGGGNRGGGGNRW